MIEESFFFLSLAPTFLFYSNSMAPSSLPSTPKPSPAIDNQTPGTWRHPRLNEIVRRQNAATFSQRNVRGLLYNGAVLFVLWFFGRTFKY
jgi:nucleoporin POM34